MARISVPFKNFWATPALQPPKSTPTSAWSTFEPSTIRRIPKRKGNKPIGLNLSGSDRIFPDQIESFRIGSNLSGLNRIFRDWIESTAEGCLLEAQSWISDGAYAFHCRG